MAARKKKEVQKFLEPLTGAVRRKKFMTVDIESKDGDSRTKAGFTRPFLIGTYDPNRKLYQEFRDDPRLRASKAWQERALAPDGCIGKVMAYLLSPAFAGYMIYAHNGGSFDHLFWLAWLRTHEDEYGFEVVPVQSSIQVIKVWRLPEEEGEPIRERWTFLDSMKLFPTSLEKLCKTFGLPGKVEQDLYLDEDDPSWSVYLKQDCVALADVLTKIHDLVENKLGGEVGMTSPSTSMKLFRRRFLGRKGSVRKIARHAHWPECEAESAEVRAKCPGCAHAWIRRGFYGGRTELFRTYGERLKYLDLNSAYVAAMLEDMPVGDRIVRTTLDWRLAKRHAGFVECTVLIPEDCPIPPLPHRDVLTGKLIFPTGRFSGVWGTKELELLKDPLVNGKILSVRKVVWFRLKPLFKQMMEELYKLRDKGLSTFDEGLSALAKILGNGLFGKWAMKRERMQIVFARWKGPKTCFLCQEAINKKGEEQVEEKGLCGECEGSKPASEHSGDVWYQKRQTDAAYIIPHISAHITSLARVRLWGYMKMVIEMGGKLYYTDTDSLIVDVDLPTSTALGALKDEYGDCGCKGCQALLKKGGKPAHRKGGEGFVVQELKGTFVQAKCYMLESESFDAPRVTMKGFPYRRMDATHEKVDGKPCGCPECIIRCKENLLKLQAGETLSWRQLEKVRTLASLGFDRGPSMKGISKSFRGAYDKRIINSDGLTTRAVVLDEGDAFSASTQTVER